MSNRISVRVGLMVIAIVAALLAIEQAELRRRLTAEARVIADAAVSDRKREADLRRLAGLIDRQIAEANKPRAPTRPAVVAIPPQRSPEESARLRRRGTKAFIEITLTRFLRNRHWSKEQQEKFVALAAKHTDERNDIFAAATSRRLSPNSPSITGMYEQLNQSYHEQLDATLGPGTAQALEDYEKAYPYSRAVADLSTELVLSGSAEPLSPEQSDKLEHALMEQKTLFGGPIDPSSQFTPNAGDSTAAPRALQGLETALAASQSILEPSQLPVVENYLRAHQLEIEIGAESTAIWREVRKHPAAPARSVVSRTPGS